MRRMLLAVTGAMLAMMLAMAGAASAQTQPGEPDPIVQESPTTGEEFITFADDFPFDYGFMVNLSTPNTSENLGWVVVVEQTPSGPEVSIERVQCFLPERELCG